MLPLVGDPESDEWPSRAMDGQMGGILQANLEGTRGGRGRRRRIQVEKSTDYWQDRISPCWSTLDYLEGFCFHTDRDIAGKNTNRVQIGLEPRSLTVIAG